MSRKANEIKSQIRIKQDLLKHQNIKNDMRVNFTWVYKELVSVIGYVETLEDKIIELEKQLKNKEKLLNDNSNKL